MTLLDPIHVAATLDFINEHPSVVRPVRAVRVSDGTGGFTQGDPLAQAPLTVRKVGLNSVTGVESRTTPDGAAVLITAIVIALPDADLLEGDVLPFGNEKYKVLSVSFDPPWRLRAEVYRHG